MDDTLSHYGTPRHSGRYPWGSGNAPYQRNKDFMATARNLKRQGMSEADIAKGFGMTIQEFRSKKTIARAEVRKADYAQAVRLRDKGYSPTEIGRRMGMNESSVRSLLDPVLRERAEIVATTADILRDNVAKKEYLDISLGTESHIGVARTKLKAAVTMLQDEGYKVYHVLTEQLGTGKKTDTLVLAPPGTEYPELYANRDKIKMISEYSYDGGRSFLGLKPVQNVDHKRVQIRYKEDGGIEKDGVIELRRGVEDLSLGDRRYAQVRIGVDGTHYIKGMAVYSDDLPKGVDILFNTNKTKDVPMLGPKDNSVLKPMQKNKDGDIDTDNPFGATIKPGGQRGALNIVYEEGDWGKWSKTISSQILSKQPPSLAKKQLGLAYDAKKEEYDELMSLTNPAVKKFLLPKFADGCDSAAVHLKAAALPRQASHVLLPFPDMKENEIYAPNYRDGERVVLIRHPHGGIFEIPQLTVNNKQQTARELIGNARDAIGINSKVAARLSGADFDGDTVLVIPNPKSVNIQISAPLKGLKDFDPKETYKKVPGMKIMGSKGGGDTQQKMGDISNLITDMTIGGANPDEIARAVRHSMVVIDAEKHELNYTQSYIDNGIAALKKKYQGSERSGASTLVSKASSDRRIPERTLKINKNKMTPEELAKYKEGKKIFSETGETYTKRTVKDSTGKYRKVYKDRKTGRLMFIDDNGRPQEVGDRPIKETTNIRLTKTTAMDIVDDAYDLSSGTLIESVYADHANKLKALGNEARKTYLVTPSQKYDPSAKRTYEKEVAELNASLKVALMNKPLEREAQRLANAIVSAKMQDNPNMDDDDKKKLKNQALAEARSRVGAKKEPIPISDRQWQAIQAGAISNNVLVQILNNTDLDRIKELATPRSSNSMPASKIDRARAMIESGRTQAEVAEALGVSTTTLLNALG
jgi:DNA-binding CsgD family transcriptional regulator